MPTDTANQTEISRLARDHIRFRWLSLHARDIRVAPIGNSGVQLRFEDNTFEGSDLDQCVDKAIEAYEPIGTLPEASFGIRSRRS